MNCKKCNGSFFLTRYKNNVNIAWVCRQCGEEEPIKKKSKKVKPEKVEPEKEIE